ncbi:MAG: AMP-binding protein [Frankia sp.]
MTDDRAGPWFPGRHAERDGARPAVVDAASGEVRTYAEVDALANRVSRVLRRLGLRPGDHVALWFDNDLDYPAIWWGARYAGLYYTLISTRLTPEEVAYIVEDSGSGVVLVGARLARERGGVLRSLLGGHVRLIANDGADDGLGALLAAESSAPLADRVEGVPMLYSSGTTGRPKAVKRPLSGAPIGTSPGAVVMAQRFGIDRHSVYLSPTPLYHAAPCGYVSAVLALGGTVVMMTHFDAGTFLAAVERYRVTHSQVVPTMFVRLLALPAEVRRRWDRASLRCVIHSGAPCPVPIKEQMLDWWGPVIFEYYSGTENVGFTCCGPQEWLAHRGSVGRPVGCEVHIIGEDGAGLPAGTDGDVYFSGSARFEYHNDPGTTRQSYLPNGWATFGDIGHLDSDGYLYLTDRRANVVIVGGVNVYPQEAENLLISHPLVQDAAVFGIPHEDMGEQVKAVVEPVPGTKGDARLEANLIAYCRVHLASVKCPRSIDFRRDLPREPNGKLLKRALRDEYRARLAGERQKA